MTLRVAKVRCITYGLPVGVYYFALWPAVFGRHEDDLIASRSTFAAGLEDKFVGYIAARVHNRPLLEHGSMSTLILC